MIIHKKEYKTKNEIQKYLTFLNFKSITLYEPESVWQLNEVIDYERKKGTIKTIIFIR